MPGNSRRGRKKKVVTQLEDQPVSCPSAKKKVGRPRKSQETIAHDDPSEWTPPPSNQTDQSKVKTCKSGWDLQRRSSELNKVYDTYLGQAIERFQPSKLPIKRVVLQRYRDIRSKEVNAPKHTIVNTIPSELYELWEKSAIPCKSYNVCKIAVNSQVDRWNGRRTDRKC